MAMRSMLPIRTILSRAAVTRAGHLPLRQNRMVLISPSILQLQRHPHSYFCRTLLSRTYSTRPSTSTSFEKLCIMLDELYYVLVAVAAAVAAVYLYNDSYSAKNARLIKSLLLYRRNLENAIFKHVDIHARRDLVEHYISVHMAILALRFHESDNIDHRAFMIWRLLRVAEAEGLQQELLSIIREFCLELQRLKVVPVDQDDVESIFKFPNDVADIFNKHMLAVLAFSKKMAGLKRARGLMDDQVDDDSLYISIG